MAALLVFLVSPIQAQEPTYVSFFDMDPILQGPGDLELHVVGEPVLGETVFINLSEATALQSAFLMVGFVPGYTILTNNATLMIDPAGLITTNVPLNNGEASLSVVVPNNGALIGQTAYTQYFGFDADLCVQTSRLAMLRIGEVPEADPFVFVSIALTDRPVQWDDIPEFGAVTLNGSIQIDDMTGEMDGTVSAIWTSGFAVDVSISSSLSPNLLSATAIDGETVLETVATGGWLLNGMPYTVDQMEAEILGSNVVPEEEWSDITHVVHTIAKVLSSPEFVYNVQVARRTSTSLGGPMCDAWNDLIMILVRTAVGLGTAEIVKYVEDRNGKLFCVPGGPGPNAPPKYWIEVDPAWFRATIIVVAQIGVHWFKKFLEGLWITD